MSSWRIVGWMDNSEWESVYYNLFFGDEDEKREALDQISVWRARFAGRIPVAVEATAQLFESHMHDESMSDTAKRQSMAIAVSQFVGLLTERSLKGQGYHTPIHVRGEELGIPEWIVNLRHESAHGFLPSYLMLNKAVCFAVDWLRTEHWEEHLKKQKEKSEFVDDGCSLDEKLVIALRKCTLDYGNKSTPQKNSIQRLCLLVSGRKTVARKLIRVILDFNFIPMKVGDENSLFYTQGQVIRLTPWAEKLFTKIFDILKNCKVFEQFLLQFCDELGYFHTSKKLKNVWVNFLLKISAGCTFSQQTFARLGDADIPENFIKLLRNQCEENVLENPFDFTSEVNQKTHTSNDQPYNNQESWTLCEGDLRNYPLGLMPGQRKTDLWQSLSGNLIQAAHDIDETCSDMNYEPAFVGKLTNNLLTQQEINFLKMNIDIL